MFPYSKSLAAIKFPSNPAFWQIVIAGILIAFWIILIPAISPSVSPCVLAKSFSPWDAYNKAEPPPGTIPSARAAFVAQRASVTLSFISPT